MIQVQDLSLAYGARTLFVEGNFVLNAGSRYGIVGANGAGKSSLLRILTGDEEPTTGAVTTPNRIKVGVLRQDHYAFEDNRILDVVLMGIPELWEALTEKEAMLEASATDPEAFDVDRFGELEDVIMGLEGYAMEAHAAEILEGLNIPSEKHTEPLSILSGGYKLRVLLAQTLASKPDALLLDEPTNHLDIVSIDWLEQFLGDFSGCAAIVSHDHRFLNRVCTHIVDVDYERVTIYTGNYDKFLEAKALDRDQKEAAIEKQEAEIAQKEAFIRRFKAKATKARQARSRAKQLERIEVDELPRSSRRYPKFKFTPQRQTGRTVVELDGISKAFDKPVLNDVSFTVTAGERVAIIGPNGIGKSTLLKILVGEHTADEGAFEWGHAADFGYFAQEQSDMLEHPKDSIHDWLWTFCPEKPTGFVRGKLAEMLFGKDEVDKAIGALSGGELARLAFARLAIFEPNVLVLDEPTNHLDLEGIEALAKGLTKYPNAILFVSHDRWFVSELATRIIEISPSGVVDFPGTYDEFMEQMKADAGTLRDATKR